MRFTARHRCLLSRVSLLLAGFIPLATRANAQSQADVVVFSENFDQLTPVFSATSVGGFTTINGTNVDIYTPVGYGNPCLGPESGHCIDLNGTGGNPVGQLQSNMIFPTGEYLLSFNLVGSQRNTTASATVTMGNYTRTFTLAPTDVTSGIVSNVPVSVTTPGPLLFTGDPNTGIIGLFLDNVVVTTAQGPIPNTSSKDYVRMNGQVLAIENTALNTASTAVPAPSSLTFGSQSVGSSASPQVVTLSNTASSALTISSVSVAGANAADFKTSSNCGKSLASGGSCTITVSFTPSATGSRTASLTVSDTASGSPQSVPLAGTGI